MSPLTVHRRRGSASLPAGTNAPMSMRSGLKNLGATAGKFEFQFCEALGRPRAVKTLVSGRRVVEWHNGRFNSQMIAVLFDRDHEFVTVVARFPSTRATRRDAALTTGAATAWVQRGFAAIDLRDAHAAAVGPLTRQSLWTRSPR